MSENTQSRLWNAGYTKTWVGNFLIFFSFMLMQPAFPLYLSDEFQADAETIGWVMVGYSITAIVIRLFSGYIVDSYPRRMVLVGSYVLFALCFLGYPLAGSLLMIAIVRTLHGAPFGLTTVSNSTVAVDFLPFSRRAEGIGYYGLSNNLATAIAPTVGVFVYRYVHDFDILFWIAFVVAGIGFAVDATVKMPSREPVTNKKALSLDRFFLLRGWTLGLNMAFFGICYGVLSNYLAIYGKEVMNITSGTGTYFMLLAAGLMLSRLQGGRALREGKMTHNATVGILVSTVGYTLFAVCPNPVGYYGSAVLIGLGNGHLWPAFQNMIIGMARSSERGTANSTLLTSWDLGMGVGILLGGLIAEYANYTAAFWWVVVMHLAGVLLFFGVTRKTYLSRRIG